jgi:hypothetical protein
MSLRTRLILNNNSGNWRFADVGFTAAPVAEPASVLLCSVAIGLSLVYPCWRQRWSSRTREQPCRSGNDRKSFAKHTSI